MTASLRDVVICEPLRTPVGGYGGVFRDVPAAELAAADAHGLRAIAHLAAASSAAGTSRKTPP